jgi:hypothetical protein
MAACGVRCGEASVEFLHREPAVELQCVTVRLGLGLTVRYSAVGVGVNSASQCGWGWGLTAPEFLVIQIPAPICVDQVKNLFPLVRGHVRSKLVLELIH